MWWICKNCGEKVDFKQQLIEQNVFDACTGRARFDPDRIPQITICCPNCGALWLLELSHSPL